jgi:hypothetical protein
VFAGIEGAQGTSGYPGDGPALSATFYGVSVVTPTPDGTVYVGNGDEYVVRRIKDNYVLTLHTDGWREQTARNEGWLLGAVVGIGPNGSLYLNNNAFMRQLGLRRIVPVL